MAHIVYRPMEGTPGAWELFVNGVDFSMEAYNWPELVEVGEGDTAEVGFRVTFAVSRLDLGGNEDVQVTDRFFETAQLVRSMSKAAEDE